MTATAHLGSVRRPLPLRWVLDGFVRRFCRFLVKALFALALAVVIAPVALVVLGYQPSFLRTDSMAPAMATGDIVVYETIDPAAVRVGDVITFADPAGEGGATTARVTGVTANGTGQTLAAKGDAGDVVTTWSVNAQEDVTRVAYRFEGMGKAVTLPSTVAMGGAALVLIAGVVWGGTSVRSRRAAARFW